MRVTSPLLPRRSHDALSAFAQREAGAQAGEVLLHVLTAAHRVDAGADALEQGVLGVGQFVVDPAPFAPFDHEAGGLEQLQLAAHVRLGLPGGVDQLAHAEPAGSRSGQEAAGDAESHAVAKGGEEPADGSCGRIGMHIYQCMNMMSPVNPSASQRLNV